jgi:CRISPR-associated protein Cas5d
MKKVKFWGDYGLFTRPEYKAEPHTYPIPTPPAIKGMLESIFWKPEFVYTINSITLLNPMQTISMHRNMGQKKQSPKTAKQWMKNNGIGRYFIDQDRVQRHHVLLKNPAFIVDFNINLEPHATASADKYVAQFKRRIDRGQCYRQPYLGCREYPAFFDWASDEDRPNPELHGEHDLGWIPKVLHFVRDPKGSISWRDPSTQKYVKGRVVPELFHAVMVDGVVEVK